MRYSTIYKNDTAAGKGVNVSIYLQGCPHRCPGCFNPETWDFNEGNLFTQDTMREILEAIKANGIKRNLSILGGEPLAPQNLGLTNYILTTVKMHYPHIHTYLWTGYTYEEMTSEQRYCLLMVDTLIDGPFVKELKDISLDMRGSSNQRIIELWRHR